MRLFRKRGILRPVDLLRAGVTRAAFLELKKKGKIERLGRGLYALKRHQPTELHTLAQVARRVPSGVVCLLSALQFHELTTQLPREVWLAIDVHARRPQLDLPLRIIYMSGAGLESGVESHLVEGVPVQVFSLAKTIADLFKFRRHVGLDVALEALKEYRRERRGSLAELQKYARVCRVEAVMRPYLEMLTA